MRTAPSFSRLVAVLLCGMLGGASVAEPPGQSWGHYGGDPGGHRYLAADQITPQNVEDLEVAWHWRSGELDGEPPHAETAFEATPILFEDTLYLCTALNQVAALDPDTGAERWRHDPQVSRKGRWSNQHTCRGVASWQGEGREGLCRARIFTNTVDARLIALDAPTGRPCPGFGEDGTVDLREGVGKIAWQGEYGMTSAPLVLGDVVVVGSAIGDNQRTDAPSGVVRGFDARTGALRWGFDLAPPGFVRTPENTSEAGWALGTPNVWAPMSADVERGLVFLPTGNPAPDYYHGGKRPDHYGSSVVAVRAETGEVVWRFQTVHNDVWDFDVPAQPTLTEIERDGERIPVVVQATKMGHFFILHRETGEPVFPVEERPVPASDVLGEKLSPTQPFPLLPPPLIRHEPLRESDAWGMAVLDRMACQRKIRGMRSDGIFTPPSLEGSIMLPGNGGGSNWGGVAVDPVRQRLIANTMDLAWTIHLIPRDAFPARREAEKGRGIEFAPQTGMPFGLRRDTLLSPLGIPCNPPPFGTLAAIDLTTGAIEWQVPLGTTRDLSPVPIHWRIGVPNIGGPMVTSTGLVFIGAALDDYLRAFDLASGEELSRWRLPAGGQATPMSYVGPSGRQYVVIAAGGHGRAGSKIGDSVVAFALPKAD